MKNIKIVLTGGPCGGKTSCIHEFKEKLNENYRVLFTEETANALLGLGYLDEVKISTFDFQNLLFKIQFINEYNAEKESEILLCDRGLFDAEAYLNRTQFNEILFNNKVEYQKLFKTYDIAVYFRTIAYEYPELFKKLRIYETPESAVERDKISLQIWKSILLDIKYSNCDGFNNKKKIIFEALNEKLSQDTKKTSYMLSDFYNAEDINNMVRDINQILCDNYVPSAVKKKTMELIR